ncbi:hypothetical protein H310_14340 [Aphanomyces invadans]|uniref:Uncharacterized protein n=1 Tax=Aphanomyces invadans TaxID=157072 RepID=A0A024TBN9_9STRA|nr:hypothetical protein H310_14340 [Aphanomyces invadans]ETV91016.1 hypothetical protein H310_14340 [Aphanomyces invadans]|eukprot:XP_008880405.1 hypothetical protein H310_14340 [Aphanomyces invadans]
MAQVTRKRVEHVGAAAQCEWKQVHLDATSARMTFAASLRDRAHALWRCLRHEDASESFPSAHDILATEPDDSALGLHCGRGAATDLDGDRRAAHLRKWAGHERWNVDAAHAAQLRAVDLAWNAYREVLTSQVSADLATCDRMPSAARAMKQRQLVRAAFDAAMEVHGRTGCHEHGICIVTIDCGAPPTPRCAPTGPTAPGPARGDRCQGRRVEIRRRRAGPGSARVSPTRRVDSRVHVRPSLATKIATVPVDRSCVMRLRHAGPRHRRRRPG